MSEKIVQLNEKIIKQILVQTIETYIRYYNNRRVQRSLGVLTPVGKHQLAIAT